jgi:hypothetical protein
LEPDIPLPEGTILIDHHNERAGRDQPTSLEQLFSLLGLPNTEWTRWQALVAANDRGHVREMQGLGASAEEMQRIREADRRAQGVSDEQERQAEAALRNVQTFCDGRLTVVSLSPDGDVFRSRTSDRCLAGKASRRLVGRRASGARLLGGRNDL